MGACSSVSMVETKNLKMKQRFYLRLWRKKVIFSTGSHHEIFRDHPLWPQFTNTEGYLITHSAPLLFPRIVYNTIHTDIYTFFCFGKDIRIE